MSLYGTRDAAATWEDACAKELREHQFERAVACLCSFYSRVRGIWIIVHRDDLTSGLGTSFKLEEVMDKHFESKHTLMRPSSDLAKSLVMLNRKILWQDNGIVYILEKRHCERVVEALYLQHAKTVVHASSQRERKR